MKNWNDHIEAYVSGTLSPADRREMQKAMESDVELARSVNASKNAERTLEMLRQRQLLSDLRSWTKDIDPSNRPQNTLKGLRTQRWLIGVSVIALGVILWWLADSYNLLPKTEPASEDTTYFKPDSIKHPATDSLVNQEQKKKNNEFQQVRSREQTDRLIQENEKQSINRDSMAWRTAEEKNTLSGYRQYQRDYPAGSHFKDAAEKISQLEGPDDGLIFVQGGTFTAGCTPGQKDGCFPDERPSHQVTLDDYYIGRYEVTQAEWTKVMGHNPSNFKNCDQCPVEQVSWEDVQKFLKRLNGQTGRSYRLPTEAEWEYAARGGQKSKDRKYAGSDDVDEVAWHKSNAAGKTHIVGTKKANELGLFDMSGNVWEWCSDLWGDYVAGSFTNPTGFPATVGPANRPNHITRGGSWFYDSRHHRVSYRGGINAKRRLSYIGFRLVR